MQNVDTGAWQKQRRGCVNKGTLPEGVFSYFFLKIKAISDNLHS